MLRKYLELLLVEMMLSTIMEIVAIVAVTALQLPQLPLVVVAVREAHQCNPSPIQDIPPVSMGKAHHRTIMEVVQDKTAMGIVRTATIMSILISVPALYNPYLLSLSPTTQHHQAHQDRPLDRHHQRHLTHLVRQEIAALVLQITTQSNPLPTTVLPTATPVTTTAPPTATLPAQTLPPQTTTATPPQAPLILPALVAPQCNPLPTATAAPTVNNHLQEVSLRLIQWYSHR